MKLDFKPRLYLCRDSSSNKVKNNARQAQRFLHLRWCGLQDVARVTEGYPVGGQRLCCLPKLDEGPIELAALFNQSRKVVNLSEGAVFECEIRFQSLFGSLLTMVDSR